MAATIEEWSPNDLLPAYLVIVDAACVYVSDSLGKASVAFESSRAFNHHDARCRWASALTISTVPVGNLGNANDPATGNLYGAVSYAYNIGTTEVTNAQYVAFLNAVASTDTYGLYDSNMAEDPNIASISRSGAAGTYTYSVIGSANRPVTYVNWSDAARFANWLNKGPAHRHAEHKVESNPTEGDWVASACSEFCVARHHYG